MPEVRREVVDAILDSCELDAIVGPVQQALIDSATPAELAAVQEILNEQFFDMVAAGQREPDPEAAAFTAAMPRADPLAGLPGAEATSEMLTLQNAWPWNDAERARMAEVAPLWSPPERQVFETRFGRCFPAGAHWPD